MRDRRELQWQPSAAARPARRLWRRSYVVGAALAAVHRSGRLLGLTAPPCVKVKLRVKSRSNSKSGTARNHSATITASSTRAKALPRHRWTPPPKLLCRLGRIFPSSVTVTDDVSLPSRLVDARHRATTEPAGIVTSAMVSSSVVKRPMNGNGVSSRRSSSRIPRSHRGCREAGTEAVRCRPGDIAPNRWLPRWHLGQNKEGHKTRSLLLR